MVVIVQILMLGVGELKVRRNWKGIGGSYIRVTEDSGAGAVIHIVEQMSTPSDNSHVL